MCKVKPLQSVNFRSFLSAVLLPSTAGIPAKFPILEPISIHPLECLTRFPWCISIPVRGSVGFRCQTRLYFPLPDLGKKLDS